MTNEMTLALQPYLNALQKVTTGSLFYVNPETKTMIHSSPVLQQLGLPNQAADFPQCIFSLLHPEDVVGFDQYAKKMFQGTTEVHYVRYHAGEENYRYARISSSPILDQEGQTIEVLGRIETIDLDTALGERATLDALTKTMQQEYFQEYVDAVCEASDNKTFHALFLVHLDNFQELEEKLGASYGDFILSEFGDRMEKNVRGKDLIGRVGRDKFILLIRNVPTFDVVKKKSKQLLISISNEFNDGKVESTVFGSIGIAVYPEHGTNFETLYQQSQRALLRSKERGQNMSTIFKSSHSLLPQE